MLVRPQNLFEFRHMLPKVITPLSQTELHLLSSTFLLCQARILLFLPIVRPSALKFSILIALPLLLQEAKLLLRRPLFCSFALTQLSLLLSILPAGPPFLSGFL